MKTKTKFAGAPSIVALGIVCMLLFTVVSCEVSKEPEMEEECKCVCHLIDCDFDLSELNEENCHPELGWAVELTLKSGITDCPLEDPKVKALEAEHNVTLRRSFPSSNDPFWMQFYTLSRRGQGCDLCRARVAVRAFLATGLFENHIRAFGIATIQ